MPGFSMCGGGPPGKEDELNYFASALYKSGWSNKKKRKKLQELSVKYPYMRASMLQDGLTQVAVRGGRDSVEEVKDFFRKYKNFSKEKSDFTGLLSKKFPYHNDTTSICMDLSTAVRKGYGKGWVIQKGEIRQTKKEDFIEFDAPTALIIRAKF